MKLYVGNLSFNTTEQSLEALFSNYGQVEDVAIISDRDTGRSRGFGFVTMDDNGAREAIEALNNTEVDGRTITVNEAKPKESRGPRGGGGGGGGFRGGGGGGRGGGGGGGGGRGGRW